MVKKSKKKTKQTKEYQKLVYYKALGFEVVSIVYNHMEKKMIEVPSVTVLSDIEAELHTDPTPSSVRLKWYKPIVAIYMPAFIYKFADIKNVTSVHLPAKDIYVLLFTNAERSETLESLLSQLDSKYIKYYNLQKGIFFDFGLEDFPKFSLANKKLKMKTLPAMNESIIEKLVQAQEKIKANRGVHFNINNTTNVRYPNELLHYLASEHNISNNCRRLLDSILHAITDSTFIINTVIKKPIQVNWHDFYTRLNLTRQIGASTKEAICIDTLNKLAQFTLPNGEKIIEKYLIKDNYLLIYCSTLLLQLKKGNTSRQVGTYNNSCRTSRANCFIDYITWIKKGNRKNKEIATSLEHLIAMLNLDSLLDNSEYSRLAQALNNICQIAQEKGAIATYTTFNKSTILYLLEHRNKLKNYITISAVADTQLLLKEEKEK